MALIFVTPSTTWATSGPKSSLDPLDGRQGVFDDVMKQAGGDGDRVELHVGEKVRDCEWMDQIGLSRVADLAPVLERGKDIGPSEQLNVGVRAVGPDLFEQILEANHGKRCLTTKIGR